MNEQPGKNTPLGDAPETPGPAARVRKRLHDRMLDRLSFLFGADFNRQQQASTGSVDTSTHLAQERTGMAMSRTYWAADRTLQAWVRTTLSMISFGFTLGKLSQAMSEIEVKGLLNTTKTVSITSVAYGLVVLGTLALLLATAQHWFRVRELRALGMRPQLSISFVVAILLSIVGFFAFTALVLGL